jgi:uncharacterized protein YecE (DUF72 family)
VGDVRIGTSGWHYPSGQGTWNGIFYPPRGARPGGFDELRFYAEHFDTVEVNATFYGQPSAHVTQAWVDRTPAGFTFSVKLYQKFTHPRMFRERVARGLPADATGHDEGASLVHALAEATESDRDEFRTGIEPLAAAGRLGALLAQFPPSFKASAESRGYLEGLLRSLHDYPVAVELRHRSWSDDLDGTLGLLAAFDAAWVQIDEPKFRLSIRQNLLPNARGFAYMRLHGRNAANWWRHDKAEDRYDYLYAEDELREFSDAVAATRQLVGKVYLYTNNHFSAKSVANAAMIKQQLGEPIDGTYPQEFITRYPHLEGTVRTARGLFSGVRSPGE